MLATVGSRQQVIAVTFQHAIMCPGGESAQDQACFIVFLPPSLCFAAINLMLIPIKC